MKRSTVLRYGIGALVAPLATPLAVWCVMTILWILQIGDFARADSLAQHSHRTGLLLGPAGFCAYLVMLVAGLPLAAWSERRGRTTVSDALELGVLVGACPVVAYLAYAALDAVTNGIRRGDPSGSMEALIGVVPDAAQWLALTVASGAASAALFWLIAWRGRRDA